MHLADRVLALADGTGGAIALKRFRSLVLLHGAVRSWFWLDLPTPVPRATLAASALVLSACFAASLLRGRGWMATAIALPILVAQLSWSFPFTGNHFYLELSFVGVLCALHSRDEDGTLALPTLRWMVAIVFFYTGFQKLLYGQYLHGDFLAFSSASGSQFGDLFRVLFLPEEDVARLASYTPLREGLGPFRSDALLFRLASLSVVAAEMALPPLLLWRRTRQLAVYACVAMVATLQLAAREVLFCLLFSNGVLLYLRRPLPRAAFVLLIAIYLYALGMFYDWLPGKWLLRPHHL